MNWIGILNTVVQVCILPILIILAKYLVSFINTKIEAVKNKTSNEIADKYLTLTDKVITDCVNATFQTYVQSLKSKNVFDAAAQKQAFQLTYDAVMGILTTEAKESVIGIVGDLNAYVTNKIEAEVKNSK